MFRNFTSCDLYKLLSFVELTVISQSANRFLNPIISLNLILMETFSMQRSAPK